MPRTELEHRALLLLLEERRLWEPVTVQAALAGSREDRVSLARALGRIADPRSEDVLLELLRDSEASVREAAAFALSTVGTAATTGALLLAAADPDRTAAIQAVRSLAGRGAGLQDLLDAMASLTSVERWSRVAPALFQLTGEELGVAARAARAEADDQGRFLAGLALAHAQQPIAQSEVSELDVLIADPDPWVRGWAVTRLAARTVVDRERLLSLLTDPSPFVRGQAVNALAMLLARGVAKPWLEIEPVLFELLDDPDAGTRLSALALLAFWSPTEVVATRLDQRLNQGSAPAGERCAALLSMALLELPRASDRIAEAVISDDVDLRACAAATGVESLSEAAIRRLLADSSPRVRGSMLRAIATTNSIELAPASLADPSSDVRAVVYELLALRPVFELGLLLGSEERTFGDAQLPRVEPDAEARAVLLSAILRRGDQDRMERGAAQLIVEAAAESDPSPMVRAQASQLLDRSTHRAVGPPRTRTESMAFYRQLVEHTASVRALRFDTAQGSFRVELDCPRAPRTCRSLIQLAGQGFFAGQQFLLEPGVEIRAGDATGLGYGNPGYWLRDEISQQSFDRPGILVMKRRFVDGVGSRFAITLSPQPWRAVDEVAVGVVVDGLEVLGRIQAGDRILQVVPE